MYPILFRIGSFELFTYGLLMALGVLSGLLVITSEAKRNGWDVDEMTRLVVWVFLMGLLGSRIVYVMTRINIPGEDLWAVAFNLRAGFVYYGGLVAAWLYLMFYLSRNAKRKKMNTWDVLDAFAMAICIGLAVGRFGCLLGGCCYGSPTHLPWGVVMVKERFLGALHPVQAYEGFFLIAFFAYMWMTRMRKKYSGQMVVLFVGIYAVARYLLEFLRGDSIRGFLIDDYLSTSQFISIPMLVLAFILHVKLWRTHKRKL